MSGWKAPGRSTVSTMMVCKNADKALAFAQKVFGAELVRAPLLHSDGAIWNAEIRIAESTIMIAEARGDMNYPAFVYIHVPDVDAVYEKAISAGADSVMTPQDQFYGDRDGGVRDKSGNVWWIGTHKKDMTEDEIEAAARKEEKKRDQP